MTGETRRPTAFRLKREPDAISPAARAPTALKDVRITIEPEEPAQTVDIEAPDAAGFGRAVRWGSLLVTALAGIVSLWAGLAFSQLLEELFARSEILGWLAAGLMGLAGLAALGIILREIVGLVRLARLGSIREDAARALAEDDAAAAQATLAGLKRIYAGRRDAAWALNRLEGHEKEVIDPADRVRLAETDLMMPLDEEAGQLIARASRRVMILTAVTPAAALDILFVAAQNLRMLRELAGLYGGRPGFIGTMRLARMVIAHLAAAGALAMSDQFLQQFIGHGLLGRLSARFGEGAVNGILTARIGLAAIDVCRPLPFSATTKPGLPEFLTQVVNFGERERAKR